MKKDSASDDNISKKLLEQQGAELLTLEVSLFQQYKIGQIPRSEFDKKFQQLNRVRRRQKDLLAQVIEEMKNSRQVSEMGLPPLKECSADELMICERFLDQSWNQAQHLKKHLLEIFEWIRVANDNRGNWLTTTIRLSKLKRLKEKLHQVQQDLMNHSHHIEVSKAKLCESSQIPFKKAKSNIEIMFNLYQKIDGLHYRINKLRLKIDEDKNLINRMEHWLQNHKNLPEKKKPVDIPAASKFYAGINESQKNLANWLHRYDGRLQSVEKFVEAHGEKIVRQ